MDLPKIDVSTLPDLEVMTGVFGSLSNPAQGLQSYDLIIMIMTFIYDIV